MIIIRALRRGAALALVAALATLSAHAGEAAPTEKRAAVADSGWGSAPVDVQDDTQMDSGWG